MSGNGHKPGTALANNQRVQDLSWWHYAILDWMVANPHKELQDAALFFDVSQGWLSQVINSDAFQDRLGERREAVASAVNLKTVDRLNCVADEALDLLSKHMREKGTMMPVGEVRETAGMALKALGFAAPQGSGNRQTNIRNLNVIAGGASAEALERSRRLIRNVSKVIDVDATADDASSEPVPTDPAG